MQVSEKEVEGYLRRRVEQLGGRCVKFLPDYNRGWPDRIIILPRGKLAWVELKRPKGGRVSAAQRVAHEELRRLGQQVFLVLSVGEAEAVIALLTGGDLQNGM